MWLLGFVDLVVFALLPAHETEIEIARATPPISASPFGILRWRSDRVEVKWGITGSWRPAM